MLELIEDINKAIKAKAYYSALALALTIPDVMANTNNHTDKKSYIAWANNYVFINQANEPILACIKENDKIIAVGSETEEEISLIEKNLQPNEKLIKVNKLNGELLYALRCSILHAGNTSIELDGKPVEIKIRLGIVTQDDLKKYAPIHIFYNAKDGIVADFDIIKLCKKIIDGAVKYLQQEKIEDIVKIEILNYDEIAERNKLAFEYNCELERLENCENDI